MGHIALVRFSFDRFVSAQLEVPGFSLLPVLLPVLVCRKSRVESTGILQRAAVVLGLRLVPVVLEGLPLPVLLGEADRWDRDRFVPRSVSRFEEEEGLWTRVFFRLKKLPLHYC